MHGIGPGRLRAVKSAEGCGSRPVGAIAVPARPGANPHVGNELDLCWLELPMSPVNLIEDVTSINEEHLILTLRFRFSTIQEPERAWQGDCVEEIWPDGN